MEKLAPDILEQILVTLDVKDLIRCISVCKSWHSFISGEYFVKAQLKHSCNNDLSNNNFGVRRIVMSHFDSYTGGQPRRDNLHCSIKEFNIVGSSNGLVCIFSSDGRVIIANPSTRELRILPYPDIEDTSGLHSFLGFGYDSSSDDYKVVLAKPERVQVLSLKTNVWRSLGQLDYLYSHFQKFGGIVCNGAIHWLMKKPKDRHTSMRVIVSFDLSTEEFNEIPQPDYDARVVTAFSYLGIIDECLCIYHLFILSPRWVMKTYNVKESWTLLPSYDDVPYDQKVNDAIETLEYSLKEDCIANKSFFTSYDMIQFRCVNHDLSAPIYVHSLVSPHVCRRLKRKRAAKNNHKMIKGSSNEFDVVGL